MIEAKLFAYELLEELGGGDLPSLDFASLALQADEAEACVVAKAEGVLAGAEEAAEEVVKILRVFNPMEVVNCAAVYLALREAAARGARRVCTGDGGDEICVGYSYMLKMPLEELRRHLARLPATWRFCSFEIGRSLGLEVSAPFVKAAEALLSLPLEEKVKRGVGKCLLRAELAERLGRDLAWRRKAPIEAGTGFSALYHLLAGAGRRLEADIPVEGAARYLYHVYKRMGYVYPRSVEDPCPICGYELSGGYCPMCGYYAKNGVSSPRRSGSIL